MDIVITTQITPTFTQIGPLCQNSTAPTLPGTSLNNITGVWSPATINTATAGTTTYTFTPDPNQCAGPATMVIVITNQITPTFTQIGPLCQNSPAPTLPGTSLNNITGSWSPATINTATAGTTTYTFTPAAGQCAVPATMVIVITNQITPTFNQIGPLCQNSTAPLLPTTSSNNISGTWNPATINTAATGIITYTFTPNAGQCAGPASINVRVNGITSSSTNITICNNQLPYAWNGNNYSGAGTYSVTLQTSGGCDSIATLILKINSVTTSTTRDSICANQAPYVWNGNNYTASGTYSATLVNSAGCDSIATLILLVKPIPALVINQPPPVCEPFTINLTAQSIIAGSDPGLTYTYWMDSLATIPLTNPLTVGVSGTYYIKAQGVNSCASTKPVAVTVLIYKLIAGIRYPTITTQINTNTQLSARNIGLTYSWSPPVGLSSAFIRNPIFNYDRQTEYLVNIARDNGCITVDTILVKIIRDQGVIPKSDLFVPKAWTPNNDGHNDKLFPLTVNIRELKYFRVFNRWGQLVFETNVIGFGWDGIFQGKPAVMDVYTWTVEAIGVDGKNYKKAGNSVLIR
jgi:gliding motility-associated-like protein